MFDAVFTVARGDGYILSTDASKLNIPLIHEWLSVHCHWAIGRSFEKVKGSIENSLPFGVYIRLPQGDGPEQVAFARVVTDYCAMIQIAI